MSSLLSIAASAISLLCLDPKAIDGDTIKCSNTPARFRLFGIQAPELGQPGARASTLHLEVVMRDRVRCQPRGPRSFGRIVATCTNTIGQDVGELQLRRGFAKEWCKYSRNYYGACRR